jgi:hypothetical protein
MEVAAKAIKVLRSQGEKLQDMRNGLRAAIADTLAAKREFIEKREIEKMATETKGEAKEREADGPEKATRACRLAGGLAEVTHVPTQTKWRSGRARSQAMTPHRRTRRSRIH